MSTSVFDDEIRAAQARIDALRRIAREKETALLLRRTRRMIAASPPHDDAAAQCGTPSPPLRRLSSDLVSVEAATPNRHPLGSLQVGGRREYPPEHSSASGGADQLLRGGCRRGCAEGGGPQLLASAVSPELAAAWRRGDLSPELAMRRLVDGVCAAAAAGAHRDLADHLDADVALGGVLGGMAGGVPLGGSHAAVLEPLRALLCGSAEAAAEAAAALFTGADLNKTPQRRCLSEVSRKWVGSV